MKLLLQQTSTATPEPGTAQALHFWHGVLTLHQQLALGKKKKSETSSAGEISMSFLVTLLAGDYPFAIALNPNVGLSYNAVSPQQKLVVRGEIVMKPLHLEVFPTCSKLNSCRTGI